MVAALILAYWLRKRVRKYFHLEATSGIKAIALVAALFIGITATVTVVLQLTFLYRTG